MGPSTHKQQNTNTAVSVEIDRCIYFIGKCLSYGRLLLLGFASYSFHHISKIVPHSKEMFHVPVIYVGISGLA